MTELKITDDCQILIDAETMELDIFTSGRWACSGRYDTETSRVVDAPAPLGEDLYDAIDNAIDNAIAAEVL